MSHRSGNIGVNIGVIQGKYMGPWTCRCYGSLAQLLHAAAVAEEITLQRLPHVSTLLAALGPAAGTLRALEVTDIEEPYMANDVRALGVGQQSQGSNSQSRARLRTWKW